MVSCPICDRNVKESNINAHIDSGCQSFIETEVPSSTAPVSSFFKTPQVKREPQYAASQPVSSPSAPRPQSTKRPLEEELSSLKANNTSDVVKAEPPSKKPKPNPLQRAAPLAERMRPTTLDEVHGQELVGSEGVLRGLIESDRVPSMILWGNAGTGKTTIARVIANMVGSRFVEINSTSSGVTECKKIFAEARSELALTGRKTIIFCDEIHRFSKSQQDVFLAPVEAGHVTLIGATTENPSFKVQNALLSRCRTFTLTKLTDNDITKILRRGLDASRETYEPGPLVNDELLDYLAAFADGDARTGLNLLELAMDLSKRKGMTVDQLKSALTKTLVYDRSGDQHYDTISAFHKSVRGSDPDAALYYLARMIQSGEDALYIARRMIVIASEDVGLADNNMLSLATATYTAAEKIGMPEARINLAHCAVALCLAPKSTRAYRGLSNAAATLEEPGMAGLPIPIHLRNAPTRLMKELGYGQEYKYNPNYVDGKVKQEYLPERLKGKRFLEDINLGTERDSEFDYDDNIDNHKERGAPSDRGSAEEANKSFPVSEVTTEEVPTTATTDTQNQSFNTSFTTSHTSSQKPSMPTPTPGSQQSKHQGSPHAPTISANVITNEPPFSSQKTTTGADGNSILTTTTTTGDAMRSTSHDAEISSGDANENKDRSSEEGGVTAAAAAIDNNSRDEDTEENPRVSLRKTEEEEKETEEKDEEESGEFYIEYE